MRRPGKSGGHQKPHGRIGQLTDAQAAIWRMTSDAPSKPGNTSPPSAQRNRTYKSRSGDSQATKGSRVTRSPTNGLSSPLTNRTHGVEWFSRVGQHKEIPPAKITRQRQAWILKAETGRRQKLGQETARSNPEPQIPSRRKDKAGPDGSESQKAPRLALLPDEDGALPNGPISRMDHAPGVGHHFCPP